MRASALVPIIFAIALLLLAACGDNQVPTPTPMSTAAPDEVAYYQELQAKMSSVTQGIAQLSTMRTSAFAAGDDTRPSAIAAYIAAYATQAAGNKTSLEAINAPQTLKRMHNRLVDAATGIVQLGQDLQSRAAAEATATESAYTSLFQELNGVAIELRLRDACTDLQRQANQTKAGIDLGCPQ